MYKYFCDKDSRILEKIQSMIANKGLGLVLLGVVVLILSAIFAYNDKAIELGVLGVVVLGGVYSFIYTKHLWYMGIFFMPLSMELSEIAGGSAITIPSDFIAAFFSCLFLLKLKTYGEDWLKIISHPIGLFILLYFLWMLITSVFAEHPIVAIKFSINTFWYVTSYYFWTVIFLKENKGDFYKWLWVIMLPLIFVIVFTLVKHGFKGFSKKASYYIMRPFYKEHTAYAASIAVFVPIYFLLAVYGKLKKYWRILCYLAFIVVLLGVIGSYTRGAWLGVLLAFGVIFGIKYWSFTRVVVPLTLPLLVGFMVFFGADIFFQFTNTGNATDQGIHKHIKSIFNLRTDESNKERLNRWIAARAMLEERPMTGFGPGNYAMTYAPYQEYEFLTSISTFRGDGGTAHSEYFLAASEMGYIGLILVTLWFFTVLYKGTRGILFSTNYEYKVLYLMALTGFTTYFLHTLFNNFLDQDKVAIPVYFCMAMITALDLYYSIPKQANDTTTQ